MPAKKSTTATEGLRTSRQWPMNTPMPKAGAYSANSRWTYDEEQLLRKHYAKYGQQYCARLLGRSMDAVKIRASRLGIDRLKQHWSEQESQLLLRWFGRKSDEDLVLLLGRSISSIRHRARSIGLIPKKAWSDEHVQLLRKHYGRKSNSELAPLLGRSPGAIRSMANSLGLTRKAERLDDAQVKFIMKNVGNLSFKAIATTLGVNVWRVSRAARKHGYHERHYRMDQWSPSDDAFLRKQWPTMLAKDIAPLLGRTVEAVIGHAQKIGIRAGTGRYALERKWSAKEDQAIRNLYGTMSRAKIAARLGRTALAVKSRINQLGIHQDLAKTERWSRKDDMLLRDLYPRLGIQAIAFQLAKTITSVRMRITKLSLGDDLNDAPWTSREEAQLRKLYALYNNREIGRRLGRSLGSIQHRARRLGLSKPPELRAHPWSQGEDATLKRLYGTMTTIEIARRMNRSTGSVRARLKEFGLKKFTRKRRASDP